MAGEKFRQALAVKPDLHEALYNWGGSFATQAGTKIGAEADRLFDLADEKFRQALAIKPDDYETLRDWGSILAGQAKTKSGVEADRLFALAFERFEKALAINPDDHELLDIWGNSVLRQAQQKQGSEKIAFAERARGILERGYILNPTRVAYNLACACAVLGDHEHAINLLRESKAAGRLPKLEHLMSDPDLESLRDSDAFKAFLKEAFPEH